MEYVTGLAPYSGNQLRCLLVDVVDDEVEVARDKSPAVGRSGQRTDNDN